MSPLVLHSARLIYFALVLNKRVLLTEVSLALRALSAHVVVALALLRNLRLAWVLVAVALIVAEFAITALEAVWAAKALGRCELSRVILLFNSIDANSALQAKVFAVVRSSSMSQIYTEEQHLTLCQL
jgi:hypothetical protein